MVYSRLPSGLLHGDRDVKRKLELQIDGWEKRKRQIVHPTMGMEAKIRATPRQIEEALAECDKMIVFYQKSLRQY